MSLLTVRQAAGRLGIGYSTLKQWIYQGHVRTRTTTGGHHRIPEAEVDRLLAPATTPSGPAPGARTGVAAVPGVIVALSGRNQLRGYVDEVRVAGLLAQVRLRIGDQVLTAVITRDAVDELKLRRGDEALAIVKSTEVMIAREAVAATRTKARPRLDRPRRRR
jgi:molybdopterin-binding protein